MLGLALMAGCTAPPVRVTNPQRVLIVADSFLAGSTTFTFPSIEPRLRHLLAPSGIDVRLVGRENFRVIEDNWPVVVRDEVAAYDPDLVILQSSVPDHATGPSRSRLVTAWAWVYAMAARRGADVWRVDPPDPQPGSFIDVLYSPTRHALRTAQRDGGIFGAVNRPTVVALNPAIAVCDSPWTFDGGHLDDSGQWCAAGELARLILG